MPFDPHLSTPFKRTVRRLRRKYRHVVDDLEPAIAALLSLPELGMVIPGTPGVRKLRVASSDIGRGKQGGFRLLYRVLVDRRLVILLFVYAKPEREDVSRQEIEDVVTEALSEIDQEGDDR